MAFGANTRQTKLNTCYIFAWKQKEKQGTYCQFLCFFSSQSNFLIAFFFRMSMHSQNKGTLGNTFNNSQYFDGQKWPFYFDLVFVALFCVSLPSKIARIAPHFSYCTSVHREFA